MRTLLAGGVLVTCDENHAVHAPGDLVLEDDRIAYAGPRYEGDADERLSAEGRLLMPGLVNAHTHAPMSIFRGLADDVDLEVFLHERVWPREQKLKPEEVYAGTVLSAVEMLKRGVTTYVDMYFWEEDHTRAALDAGIRAVVTPGILDVGGWEGLVGWEKRLGMVLDFCERWEGTDGRIHTGIAPHAPYTVPLEGLREIAAAARKAGRLVHTHLVETKGERDSFNERNGKSTAAALEEIGFFEADVLAAHSIWLDDGDVEIYARNGVAVAHCPVSNAKLGCGIAGVPALLAAGVPVGLGTDGAATNNKLSLWDELRFAPLLAKVSSGDPKALPAPDALAMATRIGAEAIRLRAVGVLAEGRKADVAMLRLDDSTVVPIFTERSYVDHLVYSAGAELVDSVWVNGARVVKEGEVLTVDEAEARRAAQAAALAVTERVGRGS
ncbi:MAG TPA: amidohydrolase [Gaiellaceae bacterium]|nr:amidohydrolase [Gaiellaceae bacterium]